MNQFSKFARALSRPVMASLLAVTVVPLAVAIPSLPAAAQDAKIDQAVAALRATGSYFRKLIFSVVLRGFFLVT